MTATSELPPLTFRGCQNVEVFTTRGLPGLYARDDMLEAVRNFYRLGPFALGLHKSPLGLGHDDDQDVLTALLEMDSRLAPWLTAASLDGDDGPACGWVSALKAVPDPDDPAETMLVADFEDIPAPIADLIDAGAYKKVSAEIYDNFPAAGQTWGHVLRRVALCGWQPPLNKALADIPATVAQFAEPKRIHGLSRRESSRPGAYLCFSEMTAMNKAQMVAWLKSKNFLSLSDAATAALTDGEVGAIYKKFSEPAPAPLPAPAVPPVQKMDEPPAMPTRDQMIAEMQAGGADAAQLAALDDATLATVYAQWKAQQPQPLPAPAQVAAMAEVKKYTEQAKTLVTTLTIEVAKAKSHGDTIKKYAEQTLKEHKATKISALRLDLVGANGSGIAYCTPAEFNAIHGPTLEKLDDVAVQKFSEPGGKAFEGTAFADYVKRIKSLPAKKVFAEKLPAEAFKGGGTDADAKTGEDLQKVKAYADANEDSIKKFGETKDIFVNRFVKLREKKPAFTADEYLKGA